MIPGCHEAEAKDEAEGASKVSHQGVQAVGRQLSLSCHLFPELSNVTDLEDCVSVLISAEYYFEPQPSIIHRL